MNLTVEIPDRIARRLEHSGADLSRRALEGFALEEFRAGRISEPDLAEMLGLGRIQLDAFLRLHGIPDPLSIEDVNRDLEDLKSLNL